jgi:hypothetical protein
MGDIFSLLYSMGFGRSISEVVKNKEGFDGGYPLYTETGPIGPLNIGQSLFRVPSS